MAKNLDGPKLIIAGTVFAIVSTFSIGYRDRPVFTSNGKGMKSSNQLEEKTKQECVVSGIVTSNSTPTTPKERTRFFNGHGNLEINFNVHSGESVNEESYTLTVKNPNNKIGYKLSGIERESEWLFRYLSKLNIGEEFEIPCNYLESSRRSRMLYFQKKD